MLELYSVIWRVSGRRQIVLILLSFAVAGLAAVPLSFQKDIIKLLRGRVFERSKLRDENGGSGIQGGTLATMISAEAEELGKFSGTAFSEPVVQIGTLVSVIGFIASTQPFLGAIALCMIFPQIGLVLFSQKRVNVLVAERVRILRSTTDEIIEPGKGDEPVAVVNGFELIFQTRRKTFIWKLSTKFLLSTINGLGMVSVLALGGAFVLLGRTMLALSLRQQWGSGEFRGQQGF